MKQKTLKKNTTIQGKGLHTGGYVTLTLKPAPVDTGFVFERIDLEGHPTIEANALLVSSTERGTVLEKNGVRIQTCEHVLAALVGMDLDNVIMEINGAEPPIMDGSARYFVEAIEKAGIVEQEAEREEFVVRDVISYVNEETGSEITLIPSEEYQVNAMVDFGTKVLGTQNAYMNSIEEFKENISKSRTFSFLHELEMLLEHGLIKGGDLNNAIIYVDKEISEPTMQRLKTAFGKQDVSVNPNGILNNVTLLYSNEAARHKLLDVIGDLALVGTKIRGKVIANKPGHFTNTQFAKKLVKIIANEKKNNYPKIDLNSEPLMDTTQIMKLLPHRPPMLLVDKVFELSQSHVVATKNVTINEPFFVGHFPGAPVMPGVLQIEAMAQAGGVLILSTVPDPENYLTFFMKIDNVKFKHQVVPGDTIIFKLELISPIRRGICHMQGYGYVNGKLVTEGELMAKIVKRDNINN